MATPLVSRTSISRFKVDEVCSFLREKYQDEDEMIDGNALLELNTDDLKELTGTMREKKAIKALYSKRIVSVSEICLSACRQGYVHSNHP